MAGSGADRIFFNTDALPERDRFPLFCEEVARCYIGLDLKTDDQSQFRATLELQRFGDIGDGRNAMSAVRSARTADLIRDGDSFTHHVLDRGLECAAALLRDSRCRGRRIAEVAAEAGFLVLSYFTHAFRGRYGATPSDMREAARLRHE